MGIKEINGKKGTLEWSWLLVKVEIGNDIEFYYSNGSR